MRLLAKTRAVGGSSGSKGGRAHGLGGYFQSGANDFGYYPPYS